MIFTPMTYKPIPMESKVKFREDMSLGLLSGRTGTVIGITEDYVCPVYIVLLDGPPHNREGKLVRAVSIISTVLSVCQQP